MTTTIFYNTSDFGEKINEFLRANNCESALLLVSELFALKNKDLTSTLQHISSPVIGGVFPKLIYENQVKEDAVVVVGVFSKMKHKLIQFDESKENCFDEIKREYAVSYSKTKSVFVFVDAFAQNKTRFIDCLYNFFGSEIRYFGGGTGSLNDVAMPSIINNEGIHSNAAIIASVEFDIYTSIKHGWKPLTEPMKISKTDNNRLLSLNWEPAFELYKKICTQHSNMNFEEYSFFEIAKSYPFGKTTIDEEFIIRDPYAVEGNDLLFFDSIVEGEYVCIMHADKNGLLESANVAIDSLYQNCDFEVDNVFVIDCISRVLFMQDGFSDELAILSKKHDVFGALSIGEIVSDKNNYLEIFNKSIGLAAWKKNS